MQQVVDTCNATNILTPKHLTRMKAHMRMTEWLPMTCTLERLFKFYCNEWQKFPRVWWPLPHKWLQVSTRIQPGPIVWWPLPWRFPSYFHRASSLMLGCCQMSYSIWTAIHGNQSVKIERTRTLHFHPVQYTFLPLATKCLSPVTNLLPQLCSEHIKRLKKNCTLADNVKTWP